MYPRAKTALAIMLAAMMVVGALPLSSSDAEYDIIDSRYGTTLSFSTEDLETIIEELSGKTIKEWNEFFSDNKYGYKVKVSPIVSAKIGVTRSVFESSLSSNMYDHISAYIEFSLSITAVGHFPDAGIYYAQEGETYMQLMDRVLIEEAGAEERTLEINMTLLAYAEAEFLTSIDAFTNELDGSMIHAKLFVLEYEDTNFTFESQSSSDEPMYMEFGYEGQKSSSNIYLNTDTELDVDGLVMYDTESPEMDVSMNVHVDKLMVSSDLANGLWKKVSEILGWDDNQSALPQLILNILKSGSRMLDLFDTVQSLTGTEIPDVKFIAKAHTSTFTDDAGRQYYKITVKTHDSSKDLMLAKQDYSLNVLDLIDSIPSYIMGDGVKLAIGSALTVLGWDKIEVTELTPETKAECDAIAEHVDTMVEIDERYDFNIPVEYLVLSIAGIVGCIVAVFYVRRHPL